MKIRAIDDLQGIFWRVRPMPAKTPEKAENQSKEGPMNTTVGKFWVSLYILKRILIASVVVTHFT